MKPSAKPKACRICQTRFEPVRSTNTVCSPPCAIEYANRKAEKRERAIKRDAEQRQRRDLKRRKEALKTRADWIREAQRAFNSYIRARDYGKPCISCGSHMHMQRMGGTVDCGHYRSRGAAGHLRFNVYNAAAQCVKCNRHLSGNAVDYRISLISRIGQHRVERLEADNTQRRFDDDYLKRLKRIFNKRARLYRKLRGIT